MSHGKSFGLAIFAAVGLLGETTGSAYAQRYALTDLGPGVALGLNDAGQVVGYSLVDGNPGHPVATLWNGGMTAILGTLPGWTDSFAAGINDAGTVVGYSGPVPTNANLFNGIAANFPVGSFNGQATSWSGGAINDLGALAGSVGSVATGINNAGQVTGYSTFEPVCCAGFPHATLSNGGTITDLSTLPGGPIDNLPGPYYATATNNAGQVVGSTGIGNAWLSNGSAITYLTGVGYPTAINNVGQVVGIAGAQGQFDFTVATLWAGSTVTQLGVLPSTTGSAALGINNSGQVVGYSYRVDCCSFATMWSGGVITNLTDALWSGGEGWTLDEATGINDMGQIVGFGEGPQGESAFLLTPVRVPKSSTWAMMLLGFAGLALAGYRRAIAGGEA